MAATCPMDQLFDLDFALSFDLDLALITPVQNTSSATISGVSSFIADLPTVSSNNVGVCMICMEEFGVKDCAKRMSCSHVYHAPCISSWLSECNSCPLCRCRIYMP
ncbi:hypothetical protein AQUCO_02000292v1 [Aquilegia coerulea]|uniref:RING-type domain-containing protein n=1 Tax=Aquilegia coerulea TaxID=218851 RepID=A0A2G5DGT1_AQUCA|nr:hypothetical protein AQUCO_02000292v1 [Aquilegia coerulea]